LPGGEKRGGIGRGRCERVEGGKEEGKEEKAKALA
jgi:hypothetical protein